MAETIPGWLVLCWELVISMTEAWKKRMSGDISFCIHTCTFTLFYFFYLIDLTVLDSVPDPALDHRWLGWRLYVTCIGIGHDYKRAQY